jgi:hypothetical protein
VLVFMYLYPIEQVCVLGFIASATPLARPLRLAFTNNPTLAHRPAKPPSPAAHIPSSRT